VRTLIALVLCCWATTANAAALSGEQHEKWLQAQAIFLRENYWHMDWKKTADGLEYLPPKTRSPENAVQPTPDSTVTVHYEVKLITGRIVDSSYARKMPLTTKLTELIPAWVEAVPMMRVGETWQFVVPAALAYGDKDMGPVPAGSALIFKIELLNVESGR
jgi:FKBP-type peptidyl-prolyl cis-trans isomerase FkpA